MPRSFPSSNVAYWRYTVQDREVLRALADRVATIAGSAENAERRRLWYAHDQLAGERPMVLTETDGGLHIVKPDLALQCETPWARDLELSMWEKILHFELLRDDRTAEPWVEWNWIVSLGDYGVDVRMDRGRDAQGREHAFHWDAPITDLASDLDRLRPRRFEVHRQASLAWRQALEGIFDGILPVRQRGKYWWTMGLTQVAVFLVGLENLMLCMYDCPTEVHRLMAFLRDDHLRLLDWVDEEAPAALNNEADYIGSGSWGYTRDLPAADASDGPVGVRDLWGLCESQETVGISPDQFAEFIFPYQRAVIERFGKSYYGCCEPVHGRWDSVRQIANLARVSVSPWCDQEMMAEATAARGVVFCRKPNPTLISTEVFDEDAIAADLRHTLRLTGSRGCSVELVMKDVFHLSDQPWRLTRWVELAREAIDTCWP